MKLNLSQSPHLHLRQTLYKLAVLSFVVVVFWIGFEIYFSYTKRQTSKQTLKLNQRVEPITANLYVDLAQTLSEKSTIDPLLIENFKPQLHQRSIEKQRQAQLETQTNIRSRLSPPVSTESASPTPTPGSSNPFSNLDL